MSKPSPLVVLFRSMLMSPNELKIVTLYVCTYLRVYVRIIYYHLIFPDLVSNMIDVHSVS